MKIKLLLLLILIISCISLTIYGQEKKSPIENKIKINTLNDSPTQLVPDFKRN